MLGSFYEPGSRRARYVAISVVTGMVDFLLALTLLHLGFAPAASLGISVCVGGALAYVALEWWAFPRRDGSWSPRRLLESGLVELVSYLIRLAILSLWQSFPGDHRPLGHLLGLAVAYAAAFLVGYVARGWWIFKV